MAETNSQERTFVLSETVMDNEPNGTTIVLRGILDGAEYSDENGGNDHDVLGQSGKVRTYGTDDQSYTFELLKGTQDAVIMQIQAWKLARVFPSIFNVENGEINGVGTMVDLATGALSVGAIYRHSPVRIDSNGETFMSTDDDHIAVSLTVNGQTSATITKA